MADSVTIQVGVDTSAIEAAEARVAALKSRAGQIGVGAPGVSPDLLANAALAASLMNALAGDTVASARAPGLTKFGVGQSAELPSYVATFERGITDPEGIAAEYKRQAYGRDPDYPMLGSPYYKNAKPPFFKGEKQFMPAYRSFREYLDGAQKDQLYQSFKNKQRVDPHGWPFKVLKNRHLFPDSHWLGAPGLEEFGGGRWYNRIPGTSVYATDSVDFPTRSVKLTPYMIYDMHRPYDKSGLITPGRMLSGPGYNKFAMTWGEIYSSTLGSRVIKNQVTSRLVRGLTAGHLANSFLRHYQQNAMVDPENRPVVWGSEIVGSAAEASLDVVGGLASSLGTAAFGITNLIESGLELFGADMKKVRPTGSELKGFIDWTTTYARSKAAADAGRAALNDFNEKSAKWNQLFDQAEKDMQLEFERQKGAMVGRLADSGLGGFSRDQIEKSVAGLLDVHLRRELADKMSRLAPKPQLVNPADESGSLK